MESISIGSIVLSLRGNDAGRVMMAVGYDGKFILVADGKKRRLQAPKRKNPCHLRVLSSDDAPRSDYAELTDGVLRRRLALYRSTFDTNSDLSDAKTEHI